MKTFNNFSDANDKNRFYKEKLIPKLRKLAKKLKLDFYHYEGNPEDSFHAYFCFKPIKTDKTNQSIFFEFQGKDFQDLEYGITEDINHKSWKGDIFLPYCNFSAQTFEVLNKSSKDFIKKVKEIISELSKKF